jgi:hypothetical protein
MTAINGLRAILLVLVACYLAGCIFTRITDQDVFGRYLAKLPEGGTESLELLPKGECTQVIRLKNGTTYEAHGSWQYELNKRRLYLKGLRVSLTAAEELNPALAQSPSMAIGTSVSRSIWGAVRINLSQNIYYEKQ